MSDSPPEREAPPVASSAPRAPRRQVAVPGARKQRRGGLLLLGVALVLGAGLGFMFILESIDQRSSYLVAARTIQRWEITTAEDFISVEAHLGDAHGLTADHLQTVVGKWATGRIPAGTIITGGLFETPPLSNDEEADRTLVRVTLPAAEAPFSVLNTGDTVALLGVETDTEGVTGELGLIGVLTLEFVDGDSVYYVTTPDQALDIMSVVDRFTRAQDRAILKLGVDLTADDIVAALEARADIIASTGEVPVGSFESAS